MDAMAAARAAAPALLRSLWRPSCLLSKKWTQPSCWWPSASPCPAGLTTFGAPRRVARTLHALERRGGGVQPCPLAVGWGPNGCVLFTAWELFQYGQRDSRPPPRLQVAPAHSSVHSTMNAAVKLTGLNSPGTPPAAATIVLGYKSGDGWVAHRCGHSMQIIASSFCVLLTCWNTGATYWRKCRRSEAEHFRECRQASPDTPPFVLAAGPVPPRRP